ncbi:MAG: hypothetical protein P8O23_01115 [Opitutales bacterium]|nr:hypothetical protein [Opitutales bacterium]
MKKLIFISLPLLMSSFCCLVFADDHRERERKETRGEERGRTELKEREKKHQQEIRNSQQRMHTESRKIHEAIQEGELSHEDGRQKLEKLHRQQDERMREFQWSRVEEEIEGSVVTGRMSREQANAEYERIKETLKQKEEITAELHRELKESINELEWAVREGKLSNEEAHREGESLRRNLQKEIHLAHREMDLEQEERKLDQAVEAGRMSEEEAVRIMKRAHREIEEVERSLHRHHEEEGEHFRDRGRDRRLWEDEEELWEQVAQGLKAAVRLGKMSEREARETWEEWRHHEQGEEDHEHEHEMHGEE